MNLPQGLPAEYAGSPLAPAARGLRSEKPHILARLFGTAEAVPSRVCNGFVVGLVLLSGVGAQAQLPPPPPDESFRYRVGVQLVLVPASVTNAQGRAVNDLAQDAFEVFENGQARPIRVFERATSLPLCMAILVDSSLSTFAELEAEKKAISQFVRGALRPQDTAALFEFSGGVRLLADFSNSARTIEIGLATIKVKAGTALYDAILEASARLREQEGRRVLVIISDGNDTTSKADFHAALRALQEAEASVFAMVVQPIRSESGRSVRGEHALISLADLTGGRVFYASRAQEMDRVFAELDEFLRTQYLIGYEPAPPPLRAEYRDIDLRVKGADYTVRHRKGYFVEGVRRR
jgi:Ca-activated chloride channel family protein